LLFLALLFSRLFSLDFLLFGSGVLALLFFPPVPSANANPDFQPSLAAVFSFRSS
jgi:hypothetical protein